jgi:hypothetical protein
MRDVCVMPEPTNYEIVLRGRVSARFLQPLVDDFTFDDSRPPFTYLVGKIQDPSHLHGVLAHLTSLGIDVVSIGPVTSHPSTSFGATR